MPKIIDEKYNEKYIATLHTQSESKYYQDRFDDMLDDLCRYQNYGKMLNRNDKLRNLVRSWEAPTEEEVQDSMYEFYNDMLDAETMIMLMIYVKRYHEFKDEIANVIIRYMKYKKEAK